MPYKTELTEPIYLEDGFQEERRPHANPKLVWVRFRHVVRWEHLGLTESFARSQATSSLSADVIIIKSAIRQNASNAWKLVCLEDRAHTAWQTMASSP